jgi:hypothetical protein
MTTNFFSPLSFIAVFGSGIRDPGSGIQDPGWVKSGSGIRDKHPGSATLFRIRENGCRGGGAGGRGKGAEPDPAALLPPTRGRQWAARGQDPLGIREALLNMCIGGGGGVIICREPRIRPAGDCNKFICTYVVCASLIIVYASLYIESFFQKNTSIHVHPALLTSMYFDPAC